MKLQDCFKPELSVDSWQLEHTENGQMKEVLVGKVSMEEKESLMYLGYVLSKSTSNMPNISHKRHKSNGTQQVYSRPGDRVWL